MSRKKDEEEDKLIITPKAALKCCRIYTQRVSEGKGAPTAATEAFSVGLGTQVVDSQNFGVHLKHGNELNKEGVTDKTHFATTIPA